MSHLTVTYIHLIFVINIKYPIQFGQITAVSENNTKHIGTL